MKLSGAVRRAGWNLTDQVLSSLTNAALSVVVARSVDEVSFGGFAVAFTVFSLLIGIVRSIGTSPLGIRFSGSGADLQRATAAATGTCLLIGVLAGAGSAVAGAIVGGVTGAALLALGLVMPALLVQEAWRQAFFAAARPAAATANDAVWAVGQFAGVALLLLGGASTAVPFILVWGGAAAAAAVLGIRQARVLPAPRAAASWIRGHRDLTGYMGAEYLTIQGTNQAMLLAVAAIGTVEAVGALRGAQVLLGPCAILAVAALSFGIPEFARRRDELSVPGWLSGAAAISTGVGVIGVVWGAIFLLSPDALGRALLGDTWAGTSAVLVPTILGQLGAAVGVGPSAMLYAMDRARVTLGVHVVFAPLVAVGGVGGVLLAGAPGTAWGVAAAFWAVAPLWWVRMHREARRRSGGGGATGADGSGPRATTGPAPAESAATDT